VRFIDLTVKAPAAARVDRPHHALSQSIFPERLPLFVQSSVLHETGKHGVSLNESVLRRFSSNPDDRLAAIGPNESYLVHTFLHIDKPLTCLVGGIGVGKTSFCLFFIDTILPLLFDEADDSRPPTVIHVDITRDGVHDPKGLYEAIAVRVEGAIADQSFFSVDEEVWDVWGHLLATCPPLFPGASPPELPIYRQSVVEWIRASMREEGLDPRELRLGDAAALASTLEKLRRIRKKLRHSPERRASYAAHLLSYVRRRYYADHPLGVVVLIDNVDKSINHRGALYEVIRVFAYQARVKVIAPARHTTYYQDIDTRFSQILDPEPYAGPDPLTILRAQVRSWGSVEHPNEHFDAASQREAFRQGLQSLEQGALATDYLTSYFRALVGSSVRKGTRMARRIVANSVLGPEDVDPKDAAKHVRKVARALLLGTDGTYHDRPDNDVVNLFATGQDGVNYPMFSLHLLGLLASRYGEGGLDLGQTVDLLRDLGYPDDVILVGLNQAKSQHKRLVWSDEVAGEFVEFRRSEKSRLRMTSIGLGYYELLATDATYVQEVMLDVPVPDWMLHRLDGPKGRHERWNLRSMSDRFTLILEFLGILARWDFIAMNYFIEGGESIDTFRRYWGTEDPCSQRVVIGVCEGLLQALSAAKNRLRDDPNDDDEFDLHEIESLTQLEDAVKASRKALLGPLRRFWTMRRDERWEVIFRDVAHHVTTGYTM
jgi:hypothetical protein